MPRKPALLLHLLNLVLRPIAGLTLIPSDHPVALTQHPLPADSEAWCVHWQAQGQPWRTEPEIDEKRQEYLARQRKIAPDIEQSIYPFKDIKLNRADVEWLLVTHENGRGPVDWSDESQRKRTGIDLRGADVCQVDLSKLPLARLVGGLNWKEWQSVTVAQLHMAGIRLEKAILTETHLERAYLRGAHLEEADLSRAHLEEAHLFRAHLEGANLLRAHLERTGLREAYLMGVNLQRAYFDDATTIENALLGDEKYGFASLADVHWGNVNLSLIEWSAVRMLGDESRVRQSKAVAKKTKPQDELLSELLAAVRANRQLAVALQTQGLNEDAARFAYRAQVLQKRVFWFQMLQKGTKPRQRAQALGAWLFSWFLFLLAGYGYRLWRSFLAYALVIIGFTTAYYFLGASFNPSLSLVNALGLSMTSFHGRGFFPGVTQLNDTLTILASLEAFVGLILEATFIATLTQRFFGK